MIMVISLLSGNYNKYIFNCIGNPRFLIWCHHDQSAVFPLSFRGITSFERFFYGHSLCVIEWRSIQYFGWCEYDHTQTDQDANKDDCKYG